MICWKIAHWLNMWLSYRRIYHSTLLIFSLKYKGFWELRIFTIIYRKLYKKEWKNNSRRWFMSCFFKAYSIYSLYLQVFVVSQWLDSSLCSSFEVLSPLKHLMLSSCKVHDEGASVLCTSLGKSLFSSLQVYNNKMHLLMRVSVFQTVDFIYSS